MRIISRRAALTIIAGSATLPLATKLVSAQQAAITKEQVLNDPDAPVFCTSAPHIGPELTNDTSRSADLCSDPFCWLVSAPAGHDLRYRAQP